MAFVTAMGDPIMTPREMLEASGPEDTWALAAAAPASPSRYFTALAHDYAIIADPRVPLSSLVFKDVDFATRALHTLLDTSSAITRIINDLCRDRRLCSRATYVHEVRDRRSGFDCVHPARVYCSLPRPACAITPQKCRDEHLAHQLKACSAPLLAETVCKVKT